MNILNLDMWQGPNQITDVLPLNNEKNKWNEKNAFITYSFLELWMVVGGSPFYLSL